MTPYKIFRKIIEFGVIYKRRHLGKFYIRKIQTFLRRC